MGNIVLSLLVDNTSGVLSRVSGLFSRRGYNIDSVTVGETENPVIPERLLQLAAMKPALSRSRNSSTSLRM